MKKENLNKIETIIIVFLILSITFIAVLWVSGKINSMGIQIPSATSSTASNFNFTKCSNTPLPQNCGIPAGQVCSIVQNNTASANTSILVCIDYWESTNGTLIIGIPVNSNLPLIVKTIQI